MLGSSRSLLAYDEETMCHYRGSYLSKDKAKAEANRRKELGAAYRAIDEGPDSRNLRFVYARW